MCDISTVMEDSGIDSDPKTTNHVEDERLFMGSDSSCSSNHTQTSQKNTTKQLQKKLEARIEQAKRIQRNADYVKLPKNEKETQNSSAAASLISIQRLPIPHKSKEQLPLIEYWYSESESENDPTHSPLPKAKDNTKHKHKSKEQLPLIEYWYSESESENETTLFPLSKAKDSTKHKQDLTDTFSIEELSEESEDSLNLGPAETPHAFMRTYAPTGCFSCQCHIL